MAAVKVRPAGVDEEDGLGGIAHQVYEQVDEEEEEEDGHVLAPIAPIRMDSVLDVPYGSFAGASSSVEVQTSIGGDAMLPETNTKVGVRAKSRLSDPTSRRGSRVHHSVSNRGQGDVQNKRTILAEIDAFLGHPDHPPGVDFIFVENVNPDFFLIPRWFCGGWGIGFGHAAVRFTREDGTQRLVNITQGTGEVGEENLIDIWQEPTDYMFGIRGQKGAGGCFSRSIALVRITDVEPNAIRAIEFYFQSLAAAFDSSGLEHVRYSRTRCLDFLRWILGMPATQSGNCSEWTSRGLFLANIIERVYMFPKSIFIDMFQTWCYGKKGETKGEVGHNRVRSSWPEVCSVLLNHLPPPTHASL
jgi:hypothetical protein|mmetsp:Transcript_81764/g.231836  ORF Transcript_81764/g.231836 Transcript_81764/m.231836 type:complete len:358 (-) Transcript_81764:694-1767(-)